MYIDYNGTDYYFVLNLQGDVVALLNASGTKVVEYTYDAWGNILTTTGALASTLGQQNALRYRGYVFDQETGLYYLQSRYYNPKIGRFINADAFPSTGQGLTGNNMFAYCGNNPVCRQDGFGTFWEAVLGAALGGGIAGALIGAVSHLVSCGLSGEEVTVSGLLAATMTGAVTGAIGAVAGVVEGAAVIGSVVVGTISGVSTAINTDGSLEHKIVAGLAAGAVAGFGTYLGTKLPVAKNNGFSACFSAYAGGLILGTYAEIVNVVAQQTITSCFSNQNSTSVPSGSIRDQIHAVAIY